MMRDPIGKVLLVIGTLAKGGAETQLVQLAKALKKKGYHVDMLVFESGGVLEQMARRNTDNLYTCGFNSTVGKVRKVFQLFAITLSLIKLCRKNRYDVIQSFLPMANLIGSISGKVGGINTIVTGRRALNTHQDRVRLWKYMDIFSTIMSDWVTCNAIMVKNDCVFREGDSHKYVVINNIASARNQTLCELRREDLGVSKNDFVFVIVANLINYKGHKYLIEALALLCKDLLHVKLLIIGEDRGIKSQLVDLSNKLGVADNLVWLGMIDQVDPYYAMADAYVSASLEEGFSNSIMEAMHFSLPIVATDVGGTSELLCAGKFGLLVEPMNSIALAVAMKRLIDEHKKYVSTANDARDYLHSTFSEDAIVSKYINLYNAK